MIGRLRDRVALQTLAQTPNAASGGLIDAYTTIATVWARVEPLSATRFDGAAQVNAGATHRVTLRWRSDYRAVRFLRFDGRRFAVRGAREDEDGKRMLEFIVEELRTDA